MRLRPPALHQLDPALAQRQLERLRDFKAARADAPVRAALEHLQQTARGTGNLVAAILVAVKANATLGEIADAIVFLASNKASFITGQIVRINGGKTAT